MSRISIFCLCVLAVCLQHIVHECAHVCVARILGEKVKKIQWLTYYGGTRVYLENEPDFSKPVDKKWAAIAAAGYVTTNVVGYCLILIYSFAQNIFLKRCCCIAAIMFLIIDSLYFVWGSIGNFGDIIGIRKTLHIPKGVSVLLSVLVMAINIFIIKVVFY